MTKLTKERLQEIFIYEPDTGLFLRNKKFGKYGIGEPMGRLRKDGYMDLLIDSRRYYLHRLAWLWMTGSFPSDGMQIDHIDRNRSNNIFHNLRVVTPSDNQLNRHDRIYDDGKMIGARRTEGGRWFSRIQMYGRDVWLGTFDTQEEAFFAWKKAKEAYYMKK